LVTCTSSPPLIPSSQDQLDRLTGDIGELKEDYEIAKNAAANYISTAEDTLQAAKQLKQQACSADNDIEVGLGLLGNTRVTK